VRVVDAADRISIPVLVVGAVGAVFDNRSSTTCRQILAQDLAQN